MRMKNRMILSWMLIGSLIISICGCHKKENTVYADYGAYSFSSFSIPVKDGYESRLTNVFDDAGNTCISVEYMMFDDEGVVLDQVTDIITVDSAGKRLFTLELPGSQSPSTVLDNEYIFLGYKNEDIAGHEGDPSDLSRAAVFIDKNTGDCTRVIEPDFQPSFITPISDGFVMVGSSTVARYNKAGELICEKQTGFPIYTEGEGFFEDNGRYYVIEDRDIDELVYHEVFFDSRACSTITTSQDIGARWNGIQGQYFFNQDGEYRVDLANMQVKCLASWNYTNIRPPQKKLFTPSEYYRLNDNQFAIVYDYYDDYEVLLFHYDSSIDFSDVKTIKIGGYGVYDDSILQWTIYEFNTTHKDYRVILEDYSSRFPGGTPEERSKSKLNLMKYFNEGNTPDIFYGTSFDYEYMGRNGMVEDMSGYMNAQNQSTPALTSTAKNLLFAGNGACYQLFPGYTMYGYWAQKSVVESVSETSVLSLNQYAQEHDLVYSLMGASDIVDESIRYNFADLWGAYDGNRKVTHDELERLISIVLSLPVSQTHYASAADVVDGKTMLAPVSLCCNIGEFASVCQDFQYIGFPSIHEPVYLAIPEGCLAISTTAENKEMCWEVLSMMFSEDVQKQTLLSNLIPVTQNMLDTYCEMVMHPDQVTDDVLESCVRRQKEGYDQQTVDEYIDTISLANTVATYDYGIFDIIYDEVNSYYSQNRTPEQIADTLEERLTLYMQENYQ